MKLILIFAVIIAAINCYPTGAPPETCDNLVPGHGTPAQDSISPYKLVTDAENSRKIKVKIISEAGSTGFKGFVIQARNVEGGSAIGEFSNFDTNNIQATDCTDGKHNSLTHKDRNIKRIIEAEWTPPENFHGQIKFISTIVESYKVFWTNVNSDVITIT